MNDNEFRDKGERRVRAWSSDLATLTLLSIGLVVLALLVIAGTVDQADVSIPSRLFPRP